MSFTQVTAWTALLLWLFCIVHCTYICFAPKFLSTNEKKNQLIYNHFILLNRYLIRIVYFASCILKNTISSTTTNKNSPKHLPLATNYEHGWSGHPVCWDHSSGAHLLNHQFQMTTRGLICLGQDFLLQPKWSELSSLPGSLSLSGSDKWPRGSAFSNGHIALENN